MNEFFEAFNGFSYITLCIFSATVIVGLFIASKFFDSLHIGSIRLSRAESDFAAVVHIYSHDWAVFEDILFRFCLDVVTPSKQNLLYIKIAYHRHISLYKKNYVERMLKFNCIPREGTSDYAEYVKFHTLYLVNRTISDFDMICRKFDRVERCTEYKDVENALSTLILKYHKQGEQK